MKVDKLKCHKTKRVLHRVYNTDGLPNEDLNQYLRHMENRQLAANSVRAAAFDLVKYSQFGELRQRHWQDADVDLLTDFVSWLRCSGRYTDIATIPASGLTKSEATVQRILSSVIGFHRYHFITNGLCEELSRSGIFNHQAKKYNGLLSFAGKARSNTFKPRSPGLFKSTTQPSRVKTVDTELLPKLIEACANRRDKLLVLLLIETGMRVGQVLQLRHEDIECWNSRLKVVYRSDNPNEVYAKTRKPYFVDLSTEWINAYTEYLVEDVDDLDTEYVFTSLYHLDPNCRIKPSSYPSVRDLFRRISKKIGTFVTPHMLRHTHATQLLRNGVPIEIVSKRLGHQSVETTKSTYEHLDNADMREALNL